MRNRLTNIPYIIGYITGILLIFTAAVFYRQPLLSVLFILLVIMAPLSVFFTKRAIARLKVDITSPYSEYRSPASIDLKLHICNPTFLPLLNCRLYYSIDNLYYPYDKSMELLFPAEARSDRDIILPLSVSKAGLIRIRAEKLTVCDLLHIYSKEIDPGILLDIPVYPEEKDILISSLKKSEAEAEDSEWAPEGDVTRDIRQIREYRTGDRLRDIYWKLTAKLDDLYVREYENARELYFLLLPEPEDKSKQETLKTFYALGELLLKAGEIFRVGVYCLPEDEIEIMRVGCLDDLKIAMLKLYREQIPEVSHAYERLNDMGMDREGVIRIIRDDIIQTQ